MRGFIAEARDRDDAADVTAWWFVEVLLNTGQVITSGLVGLSAAAEIADDMRVRWATCLVTMISATTGEAIRRVGVNVWAAAGGGIGCIFTAGQRERELIAEICG